MPRFIYLCRTSFMLVFSQSTVTANAFKWTSLCAFKLLSFKNFLGTLDGQQAYSRRKDYFDHFSVAHVTIVRVFFLWFFQFWLHSFVIFLCANFPFTRCGVAENDNSAGSDSKTIDSLPVNNWWSWIWLKRAKQIRMCSFLYFLMIQFAEFNLLEWRPSHGPVIKSS